MCLWGGPAIGLEGQWPAGSQGWGLQNLCRETGTEVSAGPGSGRTSLRVGDRTLGAGWAGQGEVDGGGGTWVYLKVWLSAPPRPKPAEKQWAG